MFLNLQYYDRFHCHQIPQFISTQNIHVLIADLRLNIDLKNAGARESGYLPEEHNKTASEFSLHCPSTLNENTLS